MHRHRSRWLANVSAILHNMAGVLAQQGEIARAMKLWEESLELEEQIGNVQGKAATLHQMAGVLAQQGEIARAMKLWEESLEINEQTGNVQGKAATLANMAWAAGQQQNLAEERRLNLEAVAALADVRAWPDVCTVLANLSTTEKQPEQAAGYLSQALWFVLTRRRACTGPVGLRRRVAREDRSGIRVGPAGGNVRGLPRAAA